MGSALVWAIITLTNIKRVLLIEKNSDLAMVNSHPLANAESLHRGPTETNMPLQYALRMKHATYLMITFLQKHAPDAFLKMWKMVLGIGKDETKFLEKRYCEFKPHYHTLKFLCGNEIAALAPKVMDGRKNPEDAVAILEPEAFSVDYQKVARAFVDEAKKEARASSKTLDISFNTKVKDIKDFGDHFELDTGNEIIHTKTVIFATGPYSLPFAHKLGYAKEFSLVPIAGDFYTADHLVDGKVYAVQPKGIPIARVHIDPAVYNRFETRIGPPAFILPLFELHHWITFIDFVRAGLLKPSCIRALAKNLSEPKFRKFTLLNMLYRIPFLGKWLFLKYAARHLVPTLKYRDIKRSKKSGGIRPQLIRLKDAVINGELKKAGLEMGIGEFFGKRSAFIVTPSPGASKALDTAIEIAKWTVKELGAGHAFDKKRFQNEFQIFEIGEG